MRLFFLLLLIPVCVRCDFPYYSSIDSLMRSYIDKELFAGTVLVAINGQIKFQQAYGYLDRENKILHSINSQLKIGSIVKDFTAVRILQLMESGLLYLDRTIDEYFDMLPDTISNTVTVRHLLRHESGFGDYLPLAESQNSFSQLKTIEDIVMLIREQPLLFEPGKDRRYSNTGYAILGAIIESRDKIPYHLSIRKNILTRLGMDKTIFDWQEIASIRNRAKWYIRTSTGRFVQPQFDEWPSPSGGAYSTITDMLKFELALFHTNELITDPVKVLLVNEFDTNDSLSWDDIKNNQNYIFARAGGAPGNNSMIIHQPADKTIIIVLANYDEPVAENVASDIRDILAGHKWNPPQVSICEQAYFIFKQEGIDSLKSKMTRLVAISDFNQPPDLILNRIGYDLLAEQNLQEAKRIFRANCDMFPTIANTWDSLGEICMELGETSDAIRYYRKSIELDPQNNNARERLNLLLDSK